MISKLFNYIHSMYLYIYFSWKNKYTIKNGLSPTSNFVISLTTYGSRINNVHLVLESLLNQTEKPRAIYLWLSKEDFPESIIPKKLDSLKEKGVFIKFVDENIKSFKKVIYTYRAFVGSDNIKIVTVDDDVYYPKWWLKGISDVVDNNPDKVVCYRAKLMGFDNNGRPTGYREWALSAQNQLSKMNFPTGVSGISYPISSLSGVDDIETFMDICPTADDVWLKFITLKNGYGSILVKDHSIHFPPVLKPFTVPIKGLEVENIYNDQNTKYIKRNIEYFGLTDLDFKQ